jgi:hypothetical protein
MKRFATLVLLLAATPASAAPQFGAWGYDLTARAPGEKPGDDFFRYANGGWLDRTEIPADKAGTSLRLGMSNLTEQRLHDLLEQEAGQADHLPKTTEGKVGAFYKAFMDSARIERSASPRSSRSSGDPCRALARGRLAALLGHTNADYYGSLFGLFIDADVAEPTRYAVYVGHGGALASRSRLRHRGPVRREEGEVRRRTSHACSSSRAFPRRRHARTKWSRSRPRSRRRAGPRRSSGTRSRPTTR